jgi:hypothetical protein
VQRRLLWLMVLLGLGFALFVDVLGAPALWDLEVYERAARLGTEVYDDRSTRMQFVYPPLVLGLFTWLGPLLVPLLLGLYAAIFLAFVAFSPHSLRLALLSIFGVFAFIHEPLSTALRTGNLTFYLNLLILLLWLRERHRWQAGLLLLTISLACLVKPTFAAFFALWLLRDLRWQRTSTIALAAFIACALIWGAQLAWAPTAMAQFTAALQAQLHLGAEWPDVGRGFYRYGLRWTGDLNAALLLHVLGWLALLAVWLRLLRPRLMAAGGEAARMLRLTGPYALCLLMTPRLMVYDVAPLFLLSLQAGHLWSTLPRPPRILPLLSLLAAVQLADPIGIVQYQQGLELLVVLLFFGLAAHAIGRQPGSDSLRPAQPAPPSPAPATPAG